MCGIVGIIGKYSINLIEEMIKSIIHRGPDEQGIHKFQLGALGHVRLSIIDLSTGQQPMSNEDDTIWIVYNGELYNYQELKQNLISKGHRFKTTSDTEVVIHQYEEYGPEGFAAFNGIFAFVIWNENEKELILARDYFGVKPLHYYIDNNKIIFSSEIKGIIADKRVPRELNHQALHCLLNLRYIPGEETLLKNIYRLAPGHYIRYKANQQKKFEIKEYWRLPYPQIIHRNTSDYLDGIRFYLKQAIKRQLISDVPIGIYLSGGIDSSSLLSLYNEITNNTAETFSLGFNAPTDEVEDAKIMAKHCNSNHHEKMLNANPLARMPEMIWYVEEPKINALQGYLLSNFTKDYVKVVLGGLGGDELFAGYNYQRFIHILELTSSFFPARSTRELRKTLNNQIFELQNHSNTLQYDEYRRGLQMLLAIDDPVSMYLIPRNVWDLDKGNWQNIYSDNMLNQDLKSVYNYFRPHFEQVRNGNNSLEQVLWAEFHTKMVYDLLHNDDRVSMANGVEVRVPLLDRDLVKFAFSIPTRAKMCGNTTKYLLKKAMSPYLPTSILKKKKAGFQFDVYDQFKKDLKPIAENILSEKRIKEQNLFNYDYIKKILNYPPHPQLRWHYFLIWLMLGFQIWYQMFIEGKKDFEIESYY